jgi:hypothetical protein
VFELGLGKAAPQVAFRDVFDRVPADTQVRGYVADRHSFGQIQRIPLERLGVTPSRVGERDFDLTHPATGLTFHTWDGKVDEPRSAADGQGSEASLDVAPRDDLAGTTGGTTAGFGLLANGEDHLAILILGADVLEAPDAEGMIQEAGGHADLPF